MKNILSFLLLFSVGLWSCTKDPKVTDMPVDSGIPPQTQTGANIMVCKVNGEIHVYSEKPEFLSDNGVRFRKMVAPDGKQYIDLIANKTEHYNDFIEIVLYSNNWLFNTNKKYNFSNENNDRGLYLREQRYNYNTGLNTGSIIFTRYDNTVAAGTFSFTATDKDGQKVEITDGYFDIAVTP